MTTAQPQPSPSLIVIFGITGDLSQRYLLPALYHLLKDGLLHGQTEIIGISRQAVTTGQLFDDVELCINETDKVCDPEVLREMHAKTRMIQMDLVAEADYRQLLETLNAIEAEKGLCLNRLYYLAIPPQVYSPIIKLMGKAGLNTSCPHGVAMTRLLVEKPFGYDLVSAEALISETAEGFGEDQLFRIDHYLARETVQNILVFRFDNPIFEPLWRREHITGIEISASEQIDIEGRARFYEPIGALRDFIQSHLLQILALVTMDKPEIMDSEHIHASKQALLDQIKPVAADRVGQLSVRAQYDGYTQEVDNSDSMTETFAALDLDIDSPRWTAVPIRLWTGKALDQKRTEIKVTFAGGGQAGEHANQLRFRIQPNEGIELDLIAKQPGFQLALQTASMDFSYQKNFVGHEHPNAYERVLVDAIGGDHTLFATAEEVLASWRIVQPVLDEWAKNADGLKHYPKGSPGNSLLNWSSQNLLH